MIKNTFSNDKIPKELIDELEKRHIYSNKVVSVNALKGRHNLMGLTEEQKAVFIKYNDAHGTGKMSLEKEKEIYRALKGESSVPPVVWNENILVTEYVENSCTFREWLLEKEDKGLFSAYLKEIIDKYKSFLLKLNDIQIADVDVYHSDKQLDIFLDTLLFSGPYGTKIYKTEKIRNRVHKFFLQKKYVSQIRLRDNKYLLHGDFHLNNILICDRGAYIIDLENVSYGNANIELAYWYVQIWMLVYNNKEMMDILNREIRNIFDINIFIEDEFNEVVKLYQMAILLNRRFHKGEEKVKKY